MADHSKPTLTSTYSNFVTEVDGRFDDLALGLDPANTTATNVPTNAIRWTSASSKWQKWNGSSWGDLSSSYAININGTVGATTPSTGAFTTLSASGNVTLSGGTANGVAYLNGSKVLTSGSALTFNGTNLGIGTSSPDRPLTINATGTNGTQLHIVSGSAAGMQLESSAGKIYELQSNASSNLIFYDRTAAATRLTLDSSGNLGLGVTPSAWGVGGNLDGSNQFTWSSYDASIGSNYYYNSGAKYKASGLAVSAYQPYGGAHKWFTAPSGTAGNAISFTQAMTLTAAGNLGIGTSSPEEKLAVSGALLVTGGANSFNYNGLVIDRTSTTSRIAAGATSGGSELSFWTASSGGNETERARIDSSGNLLVGTTTTSGIYDGASVNAHAFISFEGNVNAQRNNGACAYFSKASGYTSSSLVSFYVTGSERGNITTSGTTVSYNTSSDYRLKENIQPMTGALERNALLKPCTYSWVADGSSGEGFIAHELQSVFSNAVTGEKDAVDANGNPVYQGVDTSFLVGHLVACIQELKAELDALKAKIG